MQKAIITGGAQGIGEGIAEHLIAMGWSVAILDIDAEAVAEFASGHPDQLAMTTDVASEADVKKGYAAIAKWAPDGVDLLVSNAGVADPVIGPIEDATLSDWHRWIDSHLTGAFLMVRGAVPLLRQRRGSVVLMASTRAFQSEPHTEGYAAAKGGLVALAHALAISLGPDIRVNAICPGWIETGSFEKASAREAPEHRAIDREQHPVGRVGVPHDIAATVAFLASEGAGFITGQAIVVDGGITKKMIYAE